LICLLLVVAARRVTAGATTSAAAQEVSVESLVADLRTLPDFLTLR
jgi:hypothetical protein